MKTTRIYFNTYIDHKGHKSDSLETNVITKKKIKKQKKTKNEMKMKIPVYGIFLFSVHSRFRLGIYYLHHP